MSNGAMRQATRLVMREQFGQLVGLHGTEIDKAIHEAVKKVLSRQGGIYELAINMSIQLW